MQIQKYRCLIAIVLAGNLQAVSADFMGSSAGVERETGKFLAALSHDGRWVAFTQERDTVVLAKTASGTPMVLQVEGTGTPEAAWTTDDRTLAVLRGRVLSLFAPSTAQRLRAITSGVPLSAMEISPDGRYASVVAGHRLQRNR